MAERIKVILDPKVQQMLASKQQGGTVPPAVQAQLMSLQQQVSEAEKVMQAQHTELQTRQGEQQVKLQIAQLQAEQAIKLREMQDATAIAVARINAVKGAVIADNEAQIEREALGAEAARTAIQQAHEARMTGHEHGASHAHELAQQQADQVHEIATMHLEHQHALEQQQQAADLAPEPEEEESEPTT